MLSVAGSGKTRAIVDRLSLDSRACVITYTNNNYDNLRQRIIHKFGEVPENISLYTYFSFLYTFCYLPCAYAMVGARSINYNEEHESFPRRGVGLSNPLYYQDYNGNLLGNRLALLVSNFSQKDLITRIEKFYDCLIIDEVQDFAANDFNLINTLAKANVSTFYVGDFYQHTYDTSRDGNTKSGLYTNGYDRYKSAFNSVLNIDDSTLIKSFRCSPAICHYVKENLKIDIEADGNQSTSICFVEGEEEIEKIMLNDDIPKLFYESHYNYKCVSTNWGASKGIDKFNDVCVVLNGTTWSMAKNNNFTRINPATRNKLYVAITRARGNIYFIEEVRISDYKLS